MSIMSNVVVGVDGGIPALLKTLQENKSIVLLKFEADWCSPCKKIKPLFNELIEKNASLFHKVIIIDADECFEIYAHFKNKKMIGGIPAILAFYAGNETFVPDDSVSGSNFDELKLFFERCDKKIKM